MKLNRKLIALILAIIAVLALSSTVMAADVVQPDGSYCLDKVGVISEETRQYVAERNYNLERNCSGAQMCVIVLDSIGYTNIEEYCYDVFSEWRIGSKTEDNGVLFLLLTKDDTYFIMPGEGFEKLLNNNTLRSVLDVYCEPAFAQKDYDTAVKKTFTRLNELICQEYGVNPEQTASAPDETGFSGNGGNASSNTNSAVNSCTGIRPSRISCSSCNACSACAYALGCGSCTGIGWIIIVLII
ncbi:MAG: TPM domain-containing protein, partial [Clostridia bacterium]|nr:TPM domain-containing protein [Clostridia bacterium]